MSDNATMTPTHPGARQAERCGQVLSRYGAGDSPDACLTDFLADARHWCDRRGESFAALDRQAYQNYVEQVLADRDGPAWNVVSKPDAVWQLSLMLDELEAELTGYVPDEAWEEFNRLQDEGGADHLVEAPRVSPEVVDLLEKRFYEIKEAIKELWAPAGRARPAVAPASPEDGGRP